MQDPLPETRAGNFDRGLDASNINQVISNYNYTYAGVGPQKHIAFANSVT